MKRRNTYLVFCTIVVALFISVLCVQPTPEFLFNNATGDCSGRSVFMYNALYNNPTDADVALFGSSRTMNGINDSLMNTLSGTKFLNLGYCRYGRNLDYFFIQSYCQNHHPKKIIVEVRETEGDNTHAVTPFFLPASAIAEGIYTGNADVPKDLYNKWLCNLKFVRAKIFGERIAIEKRNISHGFWYGNTPENIAGLNAQRKKDSTKLSAKKPAYEALNRNSTFYFEKLKALASEKKIALYFLYMGSYGNLNKKPLQEKDYATYGKVLIPPDSILCDPRNYSNFSHLNKRGAGRLSLWLCARLNTETLRH